MKVSKLIGELLLLDVKTDRYKNFDWLSQSIITNVVTVVLKTFNASYYFEVLVSIFMIVPVDFICYQWLFHAKLVDMYLSIIQSQGLIITDILLICGKGWYFGGRRVQLLILTFLLKHSMCCMLSMRSVFFTLFLLFIIVRTNPHETELVLTP